MKPAVLITDCDHDTVDIETAILEAAGFSVRRAACRDADDVIREGRGAVALLTQYAPISADVIDALPGLAAVGRYGTGVDTIDVAAAEHRGVAVVAVPDYAREEVSDHALALTLALTRGVMVLDRAVRRGTWDVGIHEQLRRSSAMIVGLVGLGSIGSAMARKAASVGFHVIAHDPAVTSSRDSRDVECVALDELLARTDVVSLHVALTPGTTHLIDADALSRMKPEAYLVNTSRGGVVDTAALVDALREGRLAGAALDVLEDEPPDHHHPLLEMDNVIVTPHAAYYSRESIETLKRSVAQGLVAALAEVAIPGDRSSQPDR